MALTVVNWGVSKRPEDLTGTTLTWSQDNNPRRRHPKFVAGASKIGRQIMRPAV
jgi:hypothetical protein